MLGGGWGVGLGAELLLQQLLLYVPRESQIVNDDFRLRSGYKPHITYVRRTNGLYVAAPRCRITFFGYDRSRTQNEQKRKQNKNKQTNTQLKDHTKRPTHKQINKQTQKRVRTAMSLKCSAMSYNG